MAAPIVCLILRCRNPAAQIAFYCNVLGMTQVGETSVSYGEGMTKLTFQPCPTGDAYAPTRDNLYWKIAITPARC